MTCEVKTSDVLVLEEPLLLELQLGDRVVKIDVMRARRKLEDAQKQPDQEARWKFVTNWLEKELDVPANSLAESAGYQLNFKVNAMVDAFNDRLKKSVGSTLSLPLPTQESQETT